MSGVKNDERLKTKTLVKNGGWVVPESERPGNWRSIGCAEPKAKQLSAVMELVTAPAVPDVRRCDCGRPERHAGVCYFRACRTRVRERVRFEGEKHYFQSEIIPIVDQSAQAFGAEPELVMAAKVLLVGMWSRLSVYQMAEMTGVDVERVVRFSEKYRANDLWTRKGYVRIGVDEDLGEMADLGFWLNAMVGTGVLMMPSPDTYQVAAS